MLIGCLKNILLSFRQMCVLKQLEFSIRFITMGRTSTAIRHPDTVVVLKISFDVLNRFIYPLDTLTIFTIKHVYTHYDNYLKCQCFINKARK